MVKSYLVLIICRNYKEELLANGVINDTYKI